MNILIENLNEYMCGDDFTIKACCCGHGKYPMTIVVEDYFNNRTMIDWCSNKIIPRKKRFYVKDKQGYYYIPETVLPTKHNSRKNQSAKNIKRLFKRKSLERLFG